MVRQSSQADNESNDFGEGRFSSKATRFESPTKLPDSPEERAEWQTQNRAWWERNPMRYDWRSGLAAEQGTKAFFDEIDQRFFDSVQRYMPWTDRPFDNLLNFHALKSWDLLEIGVGMGSHTQLLAPNCKTYNGIDLTEQAVNLTTRRLGLTGIKAVVRQMDAEEMRFPDATFDFVWSWGVIHHTADTSRVLKQIARVLRAGGHATVMVYCRNFQYYMRGLMVGIGRGQFLKHRSLHAVVQHSTDGAIARFYTPLEWTELVSPWFTVERIFVTGLKTDALPIPAGRIKDLFMKYIPDGVTQFLTDRCGMGSFLICEMTKR